LIYQRKFGVGAIGSRVAEHLVLAGVSKLTLVDQDMFTADNLGRHVLGKDAISKKKVESLASFLAERMPGIDIVPEATDIQRLLAKGIPANVDTIVLATGNAPLERAIVRQAYQEHWSMLIVSTSVEAVGLGGHVIAMRPGTAGCLDCLYIDPETQQPIPSMRTALIKPGQVVTRQLTGCGAFTPYTAIDATRTALIAAEHVINQMLGYSRWVGDTTQANNANISPSDTYWALRSQRISTFLSSSDFTHPECPCCSV
jgi:molybdopterin/thiamine biosynthesis adenylyltransferase